MLGSSYIKGMLVKGMRILSGVEADFGKPLAQLLMANETLAAFS